MGVGRGGQGGAGAPPPAVQRLNTYSLLNYIIDNLKILA